MADAQPPQETKPAFNVFLLGGLFVVLAAALGTYLFFQSSMTGNSDISEIEVTAEKNDFPPMPESRQGYQIDEQAAESNGIEPAATSASSADQSEVQLNIEDILAERGVGDKNAPIRIDEFASLTCSHCATFHVNTYEALKEKYIDTGKVYFVFNDFPLNRPALDASITARCLPADKHEAFISLLFKTQKEWSAEGYAKALRQNAKLAGLSDEHFDACMESDELKKGIESMIKVSSEKYKITSTPTFILNDGQESIRGASSLKTFEQVLDKLLKEIEAE